MHAVYSTHLSRKEKREQWKQLISDYHSSKLKPVEFSRAHGLKCRDLSRWHSRLNKSESSGKTKALLCKPSTKMDTGVNFLAVEMLPEGNHPSSLVLSHVSGFTLNVDVNSDEGILKKALKILLEVTRC